MASELDISTSLPLSSPRNGTAAPWAQVPEKGSETESPEVARRPKRSCRASKTVLIACDSRAFTLHKMHLGRSLTIGRLPSSDLVVNSPKVSGTHLELMLREDPSEEDGLELCVQDCSTNGTGVRDEPGDLFETLCRVRALEHGAELLVPLRIAPGSDSELRTAKRREQTIVTIAFPDAEARDARRAPGLSCGKSIKEDRRKLPDVFVGEGRGRWKFCETIGEGGLGVVYRAIDMTGGLGNVAIKVSKWSDAAHGSCSPREAWQVYILHREAQWSLQCLHETKLPAYDPDRARLFVRYLEDHTGFPTYSEPGAFEAARFLYERPGLDWGSISFDPELPGAPYVVMELALGHQLTSVDPKTLSRGERRVISLQAASAITYLSSHGLIHRDFRGNNIHLAGRGEHCSIKVLDLGLTIDTREDQMQNRNSAVRACWDKPHRQFDWVPPEAKVRKPFANFAFPAHSFDAYSLGVLVLRLHGGKQWARLALTVDVTSSRWNTMLREQDLEEYGDVLRRMLGKPHERPSPAELQSAFSVFRSFLDINRTPGRKRSADEVDSVFSRRKIDSARF